MPTISGGGGPILSATKTLSDAQIKTLPTTPVQLVAAPGAGKMIVSPLWVIQKSFAAAAYTNVTAGIQTALNCSYNGQNDADKSYASLFESSVVFFGAATVEQFPIPPGTNEDGSGQNFPPGGTDLRNFGLFVQAINAAGNFTGGNAANWLTVTVFYSVISLP